jgi:16S rRNA C1402 N4-methylase RsmH
MKKITAKEMRFIVKSAIDDTITELMKEYGEDAFKTKTVQAILEAEAMTAVRELIELGEIQSLRKRENWGGC